MATAITIVMAFGTASVAKLITSSTSESVSADAADVAVAGCQKTRQLLACQTDGARILKRLASCKSSACGIRLT